MNRQGIKSASRDSLGTGVAYSNCDMTEFRDIRYNLVHKASIFGEMCASKFPHFVFARRALSQQLTLTALRRVY